MPGRPSTPLPPSSLCMTGNAASGSEARKGKQRRKGQASERERERRGVSKPAPFVRPSDRSRSSDVTLAYIGRENVLLNGP